MSIDFRQTLGKSGEDVASDELQHRGYAILERRYRSRYGEIDIIARDGDCTVFVEVKARGGNEFGGGAAAVTPAKQRTIARVAMDYIARCHMYERPCRFDVVIVDVSSGRPVVEVIANAFDSCV
jgi:putative endonuclease